MSERILIVDDESSVREFLARVLRGMNYEILEAASGEQALKKIAAADIDLVVTDLRMPGMDGLELAQCLQNQDADRPIIMMTAYAELDNARKALSIGVYDYFVKPFDIQDAIAGIRRALEHRRVVLENKAYQKDLEQKVVERTQALAQKVEDLEARDALLQNLLSIQEPHASLGLAVKLAMGLCQASFGVLYTPMQDGKFLPRAGVGFGPGMEILSVEALRALKLERLAFTQEILGAVLEGNRAVVLPKTDPVRQGFGMHSLGVMPVRKGDAVIALLEVGRRAEDAPMSEGDLGRLEGFLPYVAMAVDDCLLQEEMHQWEGDVENFLNNTEKWTG